MMLLYDDGFMTAGTSHDTIHATSFLSWRSNDAQCSGHQRGKLVPGRPEEIYQIRYLLSVT